MLVVIYALGIVAFLPCNITLMLDEKLSIQLTSGIELAMPFLNLPLLPILSQSSHSGPAHSGSGYFKLEWSTLPYLLTYLEKAIA